MWTRKVDRDRNKGVDSPMRTQLVSNESGNFFDTEALTISPSAV